MRAGDGGNAKCGRCLPVGLVADLRPDSRNDKDGGKPAKPGDQFAGNAVKMFW